MDLLVERVGGVAIVTLPVDELDAGNAADFKAAAVPLAEGNAKLVFDLARLEFIDSSGLGAFISCLRKVNERGGDLRLCGMSKHVRSVFELVRMHRIFEIHETREAALRAFAGAAEASRHVA